MNWLLEIVSRPFAIVWSMVLLHFIWQGLLVAGVVSLALRCVRPTKASLRYTIGCLGLIAMVAFPICTFHVMHSTELDFLAASPDASAPSRPPLPLASWGSGEQVFSRDSTLGGAPVVSQDELLDELPTAELLRLVLLCAWVLAQGFMGGRLILGAYLVWRLRRSATVVASSVLDVSSKLAKQMGLRSVPLIVKSDRVADAMTCGFWRTYVILPSAWITQMSPEMLEAVIAHELSHVRRHDLWVNFLQRVVETIFFYHPAVWWLSKQIRMEREHCCDSAAVRATGDAGIFARALEFAAQQRVGLRFALVTNLGEDRMSLLNRVQRVLGVSDQSTKRMDAWWIGLLAMAVPFLFVWNETQESIAQQTLPSPYYEYDDVVRTTSDTNVETALQRFDEALVPAAAKEQTIPSELNKVTLPDYIVEPPDILMVDGVSLVPKDTFAVSPGDIFKIYEPNSKHAIAGQYAVEAEGAIQLGEPYGAIPVAGLSLLHAKTKISKHIAKFAQKPNTKVSMVQIASAVAGQHLLGPDGTINLGIYGRVYVAGMTIEKIKAAIEERLSKYFEKPRVTVDIFVYNSKFFYVIVEGGEAGDQVARIPVTGNEMVLDAISQIGGIGHVSSKKMWISRPSPAGTGCDQILPIDWDAITRGKSTTTNYQLMPGDRLFVSERNDGELAVVEQFNRYVRNHKYEEAIKCARSLQITDENRPIAEALSHHANLLAQTLARVPNSKKQEAADLLGQLRTARLADAATEQALAATLISVKFDKMPLKTVLSKIGDAIDQDILLNTRTLEEYYGFKEDEPITIELRKEIPAKTALHLILDPLRLSYSVKNGIIHVGIPYAYSRDTYSQVHYVGDVLDVPYTWHRRLVEKDGRWVKETDKEQKLDLEQLKTLITSTVDPTLWEEVGGPFRISYFEGNLSLVVNANERVHGELEDLIGEIRRITDYYKKEEVAAPAAQRFPEGFRSF